MKTVITIIAVTIIIIFLLSSIYLYKQYSCQQTCKHHNRAYSKYTDKCYCGWLFANGTIKWTPSDQLK